MAKKINKISIVGAGTMGSGIAQIAATQGHDVVLYDVNKDQVTGAKDKLDKILSRLVEKNKISDGEKDSILKRINFSNKLEDIKDSGLVIEAIVEDLAIKKEAFNKIEEIVDEEAVLASNTSSISMASISGALKKPERFMGIHFFNPAPLMPLVEIIPSFVTDIEKLKEIEILLNKWGKTTVIAKDTPGFIVNKIARPFYGEALRIYEEGIADPVTIDWAMTSMGGFKMGPFELMDYIGNDVNYKVTETVWEQFYYDQRYKPSIIQKRLVESGMLGRKTSQGFYDYRPDGFIPEPSKDRDTGEIIMLRIVVMLINEAIDAAFLNIASNKDIELAMTMGVNYPKGLLRWGNELGLEFVLTHLEMLYDEYGEDRYRPCPLLRKMVRNDQKFKSLG